jgi:hypothetical protein
MDRRYRICVDTVVLSGFSSTCYHAMQVQLGKGDVDGASATAQDMAAAGVPPNAAVFSQYLKLASLQPSVVEKQTAAEDTWRAMLAAGVKPSNECYNAMLAVTLLGDPDCKQRALKALREMAWAGLHVRTDTFNTIMTAASSNDDFALVRSTAR